VKEMSFKSGVKGTQVHT